jgi:DNA-binding response OmpR family regulator
MTATHKTFNRRKKILLVDDDADFRLAMSTELRARGYLVQGAENGERAIRMLQEYSNSKADLNLVITDLVMPLKDGLRFCRDMRRMGMDMTVLIITGYMVPEVRRELLEIGYHDCLEKPFTPTELVKKVEMLLGPKGDLGNEQCGALGCHEC